jgi:cell division protein FtsW
VSRASPSVSSSASIWLIISVALLFSIGLLMVFNTTSAEIIDRSLDTNNTHVALLKQIVYGCVGIFSGWIAYRLGFEGLLRWSIPMLIGASILLALLFIPGIGTMINGARRWLIFYGYSFQPSECVKILIPAVYIRWYLKQEKPISLTSFLKILGYLFIPILLILLEPDNGTTGLIFLLLIVLFILTRIRLAFWALPLCCLVAIAALATSQMPHARSRIEVYLHPELDLRGKGHQPRQAKIAAGSGKLFGRGIGESLQKLNYLPEARSDYIAAIYAEETGFIGVLALIALYMTFSYAGFAIAFRARDTAAFLLAVILTFLISIQAFLNLGIVSGLLPSKGMTLPFFSQGGTSLMVNIAILFILLDISRKSKEILYEA